MLTFKIYTDILTSDNKKKKMVCCIVLKSAKNGQFLLFNRKRQALLSRHLEQYLSYKPFIFNCCKGAYIFVKKKESFEEIKDIVINFFSQADLKQMTIYDTSLRPYFFHNMTKQTLSSEELSAFGWKRFMNSFLLQIDPYDPTSSPHSMQVFSRFKQNIKHNGTKLQRKFFKRRMKMLRNRISLDSIENLLKLE